MIFNFSIRKKLGGWEMIPKFIRGDIVKVCKNMPKYMSHFESDFRAIILEASECQNIFQYSLLNLKTGNHQSWYQENQLTLIRRSNEKNIYKTKERLSITEENICMNKPTPEKPK